MAYYSGDLVQRLCLYPFRRLPGGFSNKIVFQLICGMDADRNLAWRQGDVSFLGFGYFVAIAIEKTFGIPDKWNSRWGRGIYRILVLAFINFQWVIFNSRDLFTGLRYIKHMFVGYGNELADHRTLILLKEYGIIIVFAIIFTMPVVPYVREHVLSKGDKKQVSELIAGVAVGILFVIALSFVVAEQNNPFLYGNF